MHAVANDIIFWLFSDNIDIVIFFMYDFDFFTHTQLCRNNMTLAQHISRTLNIAVLFVFCLSVISPATTHATIVKEEETPPVLARSTGPLVPDKDAMRKDVASFCKGFNFKQMPEVCLNFNPRSYYYSLWASEKTEFTMAQVETGPSRRDIVFEQITKDSGSILALGLSVIAFLYFMPEDFSKWPDEKKDLSPEKLWERYDKNVSNGPVWDEDEWEVNYIGHPYFGAAYYTHAKQKSFNRLEALGYSFMMSTCLYEYGMEAFFEDPSIQDLIVTPLFGAVFGEIFLALKEKIRRNDHEVLGSKILGSTCSYLLDPIGATLKPINDFNDKYSKLHMDANYYSRSVMVDNSYNTKQLYDHRVGVEISIYTDMFL